MHRNLRRAVGRASWCCQPLSRNDGMFSAALNALFARLLATREHAADGLGHRHGCSRAPIRSPASIPRTAAARTRSGRGRSARAALQSMAEAGVPVYDGASVMGAAATPWALRRRLLRRWHASERRGDRGHRAHGAPAAGTDARAVAQRSGNEAKTLAPTLCPLVCPPCHEQRVLGNRRVTNV